MLAIIDCLKKFEPHLTGIKFNILTDHHPLTHWRTQKELSPCQIRWNETLSQFDAHIHHIPGITNSAADALSRYLYVQPYEDLEVNAMSLVEFDPEILNIVRTSYKTDKLFGMVIRNPEWYPLYQLNDGLLFFEGHLCIPSNDHVSREKLLKLYHDDLDHFAIDKTRHAIMSDCYWPRVQEMSNSISSCAQAVVEISPQLRHLLDSSSPCLCPNNDLTNWPWISWDP